MIFSLHVLTCPAAAQSGQGRRFQESLCRPLTRKSLDVIATLSRCASEAVLLAVLLHDSQGLVGAAWPGPAEGPGPAGWSPRIDLRLKA
jgi:hypothetical protein